MGGFEPWGRKDEECAEAFRLQRVEGQQVLHVVKLHVPVCMGRCCVCVCAFVCACACACLYVGRWVRGCVCGSVSA